MHTSTIRRGILLSFLCFITLIPTNTYAQVKGLLVSPKRVVFEKGERLEEVRLVNRGDETQKYRISIVNRKMTTNGQLEPAETPADNEFFADSVLRYGPRQVELGPKEAQSIRLMSRLPANAETGEYRSHILIQEIPEAKAAESVENKPDGVGVNVQAIFGISIPVFLHVGELTSESSLSNTKIIRENEKTYVQFDVNRSGNKSVFGTAKVFADGKNIAILKGIAVYLSAPSRTVSIEIPKEYAQNIAGQELRITFGASEEGEDAPPSEITFKAN
jgi:P pilus assembly chaperone PapD